MKAPTGEDKIAVLLTSLPQQAAESVLIRLGPNREGRLRGLMKRAKVEAKPEMLDQVLREFEESMMRATRSLSAMPRLAIGTVPDAEDAEANAAATSAPSHHTKSPGDPAAERWSETQSNEPDAANPEGDPIAELRLIDVERLAVALAGEHPRSVATILSCLETDKAGEAFKRLPLEIRKEVFPRLGQSTHGEHDVVLRIVRAVVHKSQTIADRPVGTGGDDKVRKMADMLKSMERSDRIELLTVLDQQDSGLAMAVREKLYVFEDLLVIEDRSMQQLLAEIDTKTLALSLRNAPESILEKVTSNLSKRGRETLAEEISFLDKIPADQAAQAQKSIVEVMQRLDQTGVLVMTR